MSERLINASGVINIQSHLVPSDAFARHLHSSSRVKSIDPGISLNRPCYLSPNTQDQNSNLQTDALKKAGCEKIYTDKASGAQRDRPELKASLEYIRAGDTLVVWKLDRLARSLRHLIESVEMLDGKGIGFKSLTERIGTTTSEGKLVFHIFGALEEFERSLIRERTRAGLDAARARGKRGGRPPALTEKDIQAAKAMLADPAISVGEAATRLKVAPPTLYRHLPGAGEL